LPATVPRPREQVTICYFRRKLNHYRGKKPKWVRTSALLVGSPWPLSWVLCSLHIWILADDRLRMETVR
jgi:hypothetical protein